MLCLSWKHHQGFARWQSGKNGWPFGHFEGACPVPPFLKRGNTLPASLTFLGPMSTKQVSKLGGIGLGEQSFAWAKAPPLQAMTTDRIVMEGPVCRLN